ncbi:uncharacterized protein MICPUCDRAFT_57135 [Micromonas pusilla CCMP1545]|uniref:Predicted protein n=1 Tax=Micromonas pusilla (strain CCMP1545) TaxID=564608 RepID=C1MQ26_MICPC|nr:uncharacterized protein MICPUCDRAFT_57135 [Micromonas pusilla CCMP1545]EEH58003.1 predicted protein [Micromonas pusilla CCMP1545]|eukprot:XP_003058052.1 predicted protein [Micromonas pusilla CCMP1545]
MAIAYGYLQWKCEMRWIEPKKETDSIFFENRPVFVGLGQVNRLIIGSLFFVSNLPSVLAWAISYSTTTVYQSYV